MRHAESKVAKVEESWQTYKESVSVKLVQFEEQSNEFMRLKIRAEELEISNKDLQARIIEKEQKIRENDSD